MSDVQITADALIALRVDHPLARRWGVAAPHDALFVTEAGRRLADLAMAVDPVYAPFNLARFRWFSDRLSRATAAGRQIVLLGAGFDTRGHALAAAGARVFEVDFPAKVAEKAARLGAAGVEPPAGLATIGCDLADAAGVALADRLAAAGLDRARPVAVFLEGVSFFLAADTLARLLNAAALGMPADTPIAFDGWSDARIATMTARVAAATGRRLFGDAGFIDDVAERAARFATHTTLADLCAAYGAPVVETVAPGGWFVAETALA